MNSELVEGYTERGHTRAFEAVSDRVLSLISELSYLDTDRGERPFSSTLVVLGTAASLLARMGWTPEELAEEVSEIARHHIDKGME